jgi:hypothetical protein
MNQQYFANLPSEQVVQELHARVDRYFKHLKDSGRAARMLKAYHAYYGNDGVKSSAGVSQGGENGELHEMKVNEFRNLVQHLLVMTSSSRTAMECRATNTDTASMKQTLLGNGLVEYYFREKDIETINRMALETALAVDEGFVSLEWDTSLGRELLPDGNGGILREGDIRPTTLTPFDVIRDPFRSSPKQDWVILRLAVNKYDLAAKYPDFADHLTSLQVDKEQCSFIDYSQDVEGTNVYSYLFLHAKTAAVPNGRIVLFAGDDCLLDDVLPFKKFSDGELPIYRVSAADVIGQIFGYSPGCDLLALQEVTDALHSTVITNQLAHGVQSVIGPKGADIAVSQLGTGMNYFEVDPKYVDMIKPLQLTKTPIEIFNYINTISRKMETIIGVNSVTRGNPDNIGSNLSGAAMALIQSMSIEFNSGLQLAYTKLNENVGTGVIKMLQSFMPQGAKRIAAIAGKHAQYMLKDFTSEDIDHITRVFADVGNPLSKTVGGRSKMAEDMIKAGFIKRPEQYLAVLNTGRLDPIFEDELDELITIREENEWLAEGKSVPVVLTDNHPQHVAHHKSVIANPESRKDPEILKATLEHIQEHINEMQNADPRLLAMLGMQPLPPLAPPPMPGAPDGAAGPQPGTPAANPDEPRPAQFPKNPLTGNKFDPQSGGLT